MSFAQDAEMQHLARLQLDYITELLSQNPEGDELPELIQDLIRTRPYLELVAAGAAVFNEEAVNARVNKGFSAPEYDLEGLRAPSPSATAPTHQVGELVTAVAGTMGRQYQRPQTITSLTDLLRWVSRRRTVGQRRRGCLGGPFD